jgi:hypothetical protein
MKNKPKFFLSVFFALIIFGSCKKNGHVEVKGELQKWHRVSLLVEGPETSEMAEDNPFLNYRLDVTFTHADTTFQVPGFYAADGNAAETSADSGNKWMVHFTPNKTGEWKFTVSFKKGENIAVAESLNNAEPAAKCDGFSGTFLISESDKTSTDNRAKGRLNYVGEPWLQYEETGEYLIKLGVDAPENLFAYEDFDATPNALGFRKNWEFHEQDFEKSMNGFMWQGEKGKNLMGAINYLSSEYLNVFSFITFNVDGDDRNVFPHILKVSHEDYETYANNKKNVGAWDSLFHKTRFDVSKLAQWERILEYAETKGMFIHFKTHETETDHLMDGGVFGTESKLYYRELMARFGHHLVMNWNLGEENNQPIDEVKKVADYVYNLDPYKHHLVIHTFPNKDDRYAELIGNQSPLTGASLQLSDPEFRDVHDRVLKWRAKADSTGKRWALAVDEPGKANIALLPDDEDPAHDLPRARALWGTLMAGGYGVEWYFGYASPHSDLTCQDFRSRDLFWDQNRYARQFFENYLPFTIMEPADELVKGEETYCLAKNGEIYAIYLPPGLNSCELDLTEVEGEFEIRWFNPREGGDLQVGKIESLNAGNWVSPGNPPREPEKDWVILLKKK